MSIEEHPLDRRWSMRQRDWAVVFWIAFLSAAAGAFVLFGLINPLDMVNAWADQYDIGVRLAYGLAFAFLYRDSGIGGHVLVCPGEAVKERGLASVRLTGEGYVNGVVLGHVACS